jgi:hypothetical protein
VFEPLQVAGEGLGDAGAAGGFAVPAAGLGVGLQVLDVCGLGADGVGSFRAGDEVVAGLALAQGQAPAAWCREQ